MSLHRLYFDESGDHTYHALDAVPRRFLALCGVIFEDQEYRLFQQEFEQLKRNFFKGDPDENIVLHREDILNRRGLFCVLQDDAKRREFDAALTGLLQKTPFAGILVVLDKKAHLAGAHAAVHPYHHCLAALLERYCLWLGDRRGDVLGESRGGNEDRHLKAAYQAIFQAGTLRHGAEFFQARLTSKDIKLKPKEKNIAGLQLADLLAHPAKQRCLARHSVPEVVEGDFGRRVADLLWPKLGKAKDDDLCPSGEILLA
ncbi:MAG: DUF3800 domain-containing protein [Verrucomicrobiota bacterium]